VVIDLPDRESVFDTRAALLAWLRAGPAPGLATLEEYHRVVDDGAHADVHWELSTWFWERRLAHDIVAANLALLKELVGIDLHVQRYPYLRIARPARPSDVTGLHRDTLYGASPYELSLLVPFTDVTETSAMQVVSGSHAESAAAYPAVRQDAPDVEPGSRAHQMGFPYAPQRLAPEAAARAEPVPLRVGQALAFGLGLVHGQSVNAGEQTRVSVDVRVVNSLAPVTLARGVRADYYEPLSAAPVTRLAQRYPDLERDA
jgi:ectoine hydroxylase-related dioxygenase (phytanoyl-CoA dioxygenase family)